MKTRDNIYGHGETNSGHNPHVRSGVLRFAGIRDEEKWKVEGSLITHYHINDQGKKVSYNLNGLEVKQPQYILVEFKTGEPESILISIIPLEKIPYIQFLAKQVISCFERRESLKEFEQEYKKTLDEHVREGVLYPWSRCSSFEEFLEKIKTDKKTRRKILKYEPLLKKYLKYL